MLQNNTYHIYRLYQICMYTSFTCWMILQCVISCLHLREDVFLFRLTRSLAMMMWYFVKCRLAWFEKSTLLLIKYIYIITKNSMPTCFKYIYSYFLATLHKSLNLNKYVCIIIIPSIIFNQDIILYATQGIFICLRQNQLIVIGFETKAISH